MSLFTRKRPVDSARRARVLRPAVEALETRQLMTATVPADYVQIGSVNVTALSGAGADTPALQAGKNYYFVADGEHQLAKSPIREADAAGYESSPGHWVAGTHLHVGSVDWGSTHASDNQYGAAYTATADGPVHAYISDSNYTDNAGSITLRVYAPVVRTVAVESELITVGRTEEVTVTLSGPNSAGQALTIKSFDSSLISPVWKNGNNVTDANGQATLVVTALTTEGTSPLLIADPVGNQGNGAQQNGKLKIDPIPDTVVYTGGKKTVDIVIRDAKGTPVKDEVASADDDNRDAPKVGVSGDYSSRHGAFSKPSDAQGKTTLTITGIGKTGNAPTQIVVKPGAAGEKGDGVNVNVTVKDPIVKIDAVAAVAQGGTTKVTVTVVQDDGTTPLEGVAVRVDTADSTKATAAPDTPIDVGVGLTDAQGHCVFTITSGGAKGDTVNLVAKGTIGDITSDPCVVTIQ